jgi:hypothetical protein
MARLLADENFPSKAVQALRSLGHDVETALEAGFANQGLPDEELLASATGMGRAVLTLNRKHFLRLHRTHPQHAGIVVCTEDNDHAAIAERIHEAILALSELEGQLIRVNRPNRPPASAV